MNPQIGAGVVKIDIVFDDYWYLNVVGAQAPLVVVFGLSEEGRTVVVECWEGRRAIFIVMHGRRVTGFVHAY